MSGKLSQWHVAKSSLHDRRLAPLPDPRNGLIEIGSRPISAQYSAIMVVRNVTKFRHGESLTKDPNISFDMINNLATTSTSTTRCRRLTGQVEL